MLKSSTVHKRLLLFSIFILCLFSVPFFSSAFAAGEFSTSYSVTYAFNSDAEAEVIAEVRIRNLTAQYYVSEYTLILGSSTISDVSARDALGSLPVQVSDTHLESGKEGTKIHVIFNEQVAGQNQELVWYLRYTDKSVVEKRGLVWQVNLPRLALQHEMASYTVDLHIPDSFGSLLYVSPQPQSSSKLDNYHVYSFDKAQFANSGIRAGFGSGQLYYFELLYHLKNPSISSAATEIALPPELPNFQQIIFNSIDPAPREIQVDADGNYLAQYRLGGNSAIDVKVRGWAQVTNRSGSNTGKDLGVYLASDTFWPVEAEEIQKIAEEIKGKFLPGGEDKEAELAQAVYDYVVATLSYSQNRDEQSLQRLGALQALQQPDNAVCMEYTDLFVTLARAVGLPARTIEGYAHAENSSTRPGSEEDVLHAWAQVHLSDRGWVNVDPTWGSTTGQDYLSSFDINHLAFVVKGVDSEYPYPAGVYKTTAEQVGDVKVRFGTLEEYQSLVATKPKPEVNLNVVPLSLGGYPFGGWLEVKNNTGFTFYDVNVALDGEFRIADSNIFSLDTLLPFSNYSHRLRFSADTILSKVGVVNLETSYTYFDSENVVRMVESERIKSRPVVLWIVCGITLLIFTFIMLRVVVKRLRSRF